MCILKIFVWVPLGGTGADCPLPREPRSGFAEFLCALDLLPELQDSWMLGFQAPRSPHQTTEGMFGPLVS